MLWFLRLFENFILQKYGRNTEKERRNTSSESPLLAMCDDISTEKINFNYSLKNIPIPSKTSCDLKLIEKIESVIKRMRWKAFFHLNKNGKNEVETEKFGFKNKNNTM